MVPSSSSATCCRCATNRNHIPGRPCRFFEERKTGHSLSACLLDCPCAACSPRLNMSRITSNVHLQFQL